jgi:hypothetical protein
MKAWAAKLREDNGGTAITSKPAEELMRLYAELRAHVLEGVKHLMETVQLEPGKYHLQLTLSYRRPSGLLTPLHSSSSSIQFSMPTNMLPPAQERRVARPCDNSGSTKSARATVRALCDKRLVTPLRLTHGVYHQDSIELAPRSE